MLEIVFFTSNLVKLAHARYLCRNYDVQIAGFREKTFRANYVEPRIYDRANLLDLSYRDALKRWGKAYSQEKKLFIIEDTSVIIEALSSEHEEPGLDVKYWMEKTNFGLLDAQLKALNNNRRVIVRSDLVLHLSQDLREAKSGKEYLCFTGTSSGNVVQHERIFETNPMYPWLDNQTFNKWFVPDGCSVPVSMLSISEASKYDFRAPAFNEMLLFLEEHKIIQRCAPHPVQTNFDFDFPLLIVCGPSCAGKTTLAEHLAEQYGYYHIEASDFMYLSYYQRHGLVAKGNIGDFAAQALNEQPEIVAEQILCNIQQNQQMPLIITGFRSPAEIDWFIHNCNGKYLVEIVFVTATEDIRFSRSLARQREGEAENREMFILRDAQQASMGLAELETRYASNLISNNESLEDYFNNFEKTYVSNFLMPFEARPAEPASPIGLEDLILKALSKKRAEGEFFTTTEIAQLINQLPDAKPKSKNNVSRYFNQSYHPYYEIKIINGKKKYRLSNTGYGKSKTIG